MEITRIPLEGAENTRDLGGMETSDGRSIRPCRLIRSGNLFGTTEKDRKILAEEYQVSTIIDFRTPMEQQQKPDPIIGGAEYVVLPVLEEQKMGITRETRTDESMESVIARMAQNGAEHMADYMEDIYRNLISNPFSQKQYARFFDILLKQEEGAVLWHCTAGKDRAGTAAILLLCTLRVPRETIITDYQKTGEFTAEAIQKTVETVAAQTQSRQAGEAMRAVLDARKSYAEMVFSEMETECRSVEQYLEQKLELDERKREKLQNMYLR